MAALRIALGLLLLIELTLRLCDVGAFYSDDGVLPRATLLGLDDIGRISLLLASGGHWWAMLLIGAAWLAAGAFALGWHTRLASILLFVLIGSLQSRNPLVLIGGDIVMMMLLFWSMFLPMGARFSADAAVAETPPPRSHRHRSVAGTALLIQVVAVYFFSAVLKSGDAWWPDGTAVYYTLELARYTTDIGRWLQQFEGLTRALTYGVYALEWLAPLLVFSPIATQRLRLLAFALLVVMHIGFALCLELGHFPYVSLVALLALAPSLLWTRLQRRLGRGRGGVRIYYDRDCGFCLASCRLLRVFLALPRTRIAPAQEVPRAQRLMDAHWSWVIIDADSVAHLKYDAFVALLRASPIWFWLAPLAGMAPLQRAGTYLYDAVAGSRGRTAEATRWFWQQRAVRWRVGALQQSLAGAALVLVLAWNLQTIDLLPARTLQPAAPLMSALRIDQRWDMFAPAPSRRDGWIVMPATLENGREINLRAPDGPLDWSRPQPPNHHRSVRWHSYEWRLLDLRDASLFLAYGRYLCRQYNSGTAIGSRIQRFDMVYVIRHTPPPGGEATLQRRTAWQHQCLPTPATSFPDA